MKVTVTTAIVTTILIANTQAWAHHSHANYVESEWLSLEGTVREVHWMNPHSWIYLDVVDTDGQSRAWALEGASPATLLRDGWSRESVEVSDHITVRCHQLKDRSNGCLLGFLTPEGGVEKEFD